MKHAIALAGLLLAFTLPSWAQQVTPGGPSPDQAAKMKEWCQANPEQCDKVKSRREQCKQDPQKCEQMRERIREKCKQDPQKCEQLREQLRERKSGAGDGAPQAAPK
jgi:hypothetical protein